MSICAFTLMFSSTWMTLSWDTTYSITPTQHPALYYYFSNCLAFHCASSLLTSLTALWRNKDKQRLINYYGRPSTQASLVWIPSQSNKHQLLTTPHKTIQSTSQHYIPCHHGSHVGATTHGKHWNCGLCSALWHGCIRLAICHCIMCARLLLCARNFWDVGHVSSL